MSQNQQELQGRADAPSANDASSPRAVVATGILIRGEVSGDEDLIVNGRIEGNISLPSSRVTIGEDGLVQANIHARVIDVHGRVEGDLRGDEQVSVQASGDVVGNISAPRVSLADGSRFRGAIDMDVKAAVGELRKPVTRPIAMAAVDR